MNQTRRSFIQYAGTAAVASALPISLHAAQGQKVNVVWITGEDVCPDIGCYGNPLVHTPNIDRLAKQGIRYTNAFTTSPVCSASRSAFMTGMYQTTIGAHHHRSHRDDGYQLPGGARLITDWFRDAGYYTCNVTQVAPGVKGTGKTDFDFNVENPFDGNDWSQRDEGQPFFAHINFPETHRKFKADPEHPINPDEVTVPPYYPDHPITRKDWALYLETVNHLDRKVGAVLKRLDDEGLSDNTIVFFFGDHGRCHVRGKQWLYDGGIHVPLIVRWPGKLPEGEVRDQMVSAIDLAPTALHLAGAPVPEVLQGQLFLGENAKPRHSIVAARDRCDETMDRIRCIRTKEFKYIRNFMPERPYLQINRYKEASYPVLRLMRRLYKEGKLTPAQEHFMAQKRPKEELYDLRNDPHEVHNLADSPAHQTTLLKMRAQLDQWIVETNDQGEIAEDPAITKKYEEQMKKNYDKRLNKLYAEEGMGEPLW
ncbi:MAG: sulfatase [Candidatus Hinthialibacter antarcticus]|nr:sulfatase [Candidatus Hinthialibacter antarcticus]